MERKATYTAEIKMAAVKQYLEGKESQKSIAELLEIAKSSFHV